ncbi:uncharacterized protein LOC117899028 [Drosophila subobscura]|uniref:uncharacterized protein LOC117899028 n=1 Tax=Drosophila subobscura TaxID=7241 RepID=UPI00155AA66A|nr:uncharacterized protein LOC117899028 [Drosophila subobscura]
MSETKKLLAKLLCDIYGKQEELARSMLLSGRGMDPYPEDFPSRSLVKKKGQMSRLVNGMTGGRAVLEKLDVLKLADVADILKTEILLMGYMLQTVLIARDRKKRQQEVLCKFIITSVERCK